MKSDILLVDDDPGAIQLLGRILAGERALRFATNGPDALIQQTKDRIAMAVEAVRRLVQDQELDRWRASK